MRQINGLASNLRKIQFSDLIGNHKCESGSNSARALAVGEFNSEFNRMFNSTSIVLDGDIMPSFSS